MTAIVSSYEWVLSRRAVSARNGQEWAASDANAQPNGALRGESTGLARGRNAFGKARYWKRAKGRSIQALHALMGPQE
jgi:hypothetical protein